MDAKAAEEIDGFHFDLVFTGICAYDPDGGFSALSYRDATFKKRLLTRAGKRGGAVYPRQAQPYLRPLPLPARRAVDHLVTARGVHPQLELQVAQGGGGVWHSDLPTGE